jgi:hypothetical protein
MTARYHPTDASSSGEGSPPNANDGSTSTVWLAASTDTTPWWQVFLEVTNRVSVIELTFPTAGNYRYTIDVSTDSASWTTVVDESNTTSTDQTRCATGDFGAVTFIRVNFVSWPSGQQPGLAEVAVGGTPGS